MYSVMIFRLTETAEVGRDHSGSSRHTEYTRHTRDNTLNGYTSTESAMLIPTYETNSDRFKIANFNFMFYYLICSRMQILFIQICLRSIANRHYSQICRCIHIYFIKKTRAMSANCWGGGGLSGLYRFICT